MACSAWRYSLGGAGRSIVVAANQPAAMLYSKIAAWSGTIILSADILGVQEAQWAKAVGVVLASGGVLAILFWKLVSWLSKKILARVDVINGLPEAMAAYEARAIERDVLWQARLAQWELRFDGTDAKLNASMALQSAIVTGLTNRIDATATAQRRTEERLDELERFIRDTDRRISAAVAS